MSDAKAMTYDGLTEEMLPMFEHAKQMLEQRKGSSYACFLIQNKFGDNTKAVEWISERLEPWSSFAGWLITVTGIDFPDEMVRQAKIVWLGDIIGQIKANRTF